MTGVPETVDVVEAAERRGVSVKTIRRWLAADTIRKVQPGGPGGKVWVYVDDLFRVAEQSSDDTQQAEDDR